MGSTPSVSSNLRSAGEVGSQSGATLSEGAEGILNPTLSLLPIDCLAPHWPTHQNPEARGPIEVGRPGQPPGAEKGKERWRMGLGRARAQQTELLGPLPTIRGHHLGFCPEAAQLSLLGRAADKQGLSTLPSPAPSVLCPQGSGPSDPQKSQGFRVPELHGPRAWPSEFHVCKRGQRLMPPCGAQSLLGSVPGLCLAKVF